MGCETEPWSADDMARLRSMFDDEVADAAIAVKLRRSERAVATKRQLLGLVRYHRQTRPPIKSAKREEQLQTQIDEAAEDAARWRNRSRHFEAALDLALALADTRADSHEIADSCRAAFDRSPKA